MFGQAWTDDNDGAGGHGGCDTRDNVLSKQLTEVGYRPRTGECVVVIGVLQDPDYVVHRTSLAAVCDARASAARRHRPLRVVRPL